MELERVSRLAPDDLAPADGELEPEQFTVDPLEFNRVLEAFSNGSITLDQEFKLNNWFDALDDGLLPQEQGEKLVRVYFGLVKDVDNCQSLRLNRCSDYPEVDRATDHILAELADLPKGLGNKPKTKVFLKMALLNLLHVHLLDQTKWIRYSRDDRYYKKRLQSRYNPLGIGHRPLIRVMNALKALGYVEECVHYKPIANKFDGRQTRIRATDELISLLRDRFKITPQMISEYGRLDPIRLKDKERLYKEYKDTAETKKMRLQIDNYNDLLESSDINLKDCQKVAEQKLLHPIDFTRTRYFRTFEKGSFKLGGRFYGHWAQDMKKEFRPYLLINGNHTVELDYEAMYVHLAYCLEKECYRDCFGDEAPYYLPQLPVLDRGISKSVLLISFNNVSETTLLKAVNKKLLKLGIYKGDVDLKEVLAAHREKHFRINDMILTRCGSVLTNLESKVSQAAVDKLLEAGIAALNVHDSFIVEEQHEETLRECMTEVWQELGLTSVPYIGKA